MTPAAVERCRVLEVGCGDAGKPAADGLWVAGKRFRRFPPRVGTGCHRAAGNDIRTCERDVAARGEAALEACRQSVARRYRDCPAGGEAAPLGSLGTRTAGRGVCGSSVTDGGANVAPPCGVVRATAAATVPSTPATNRHSA
jgi:hypothetical protein